MSGASQLHRQKRALKSILLEHSALDRFDMTEFMYNKQQSMQTPLLLALLQDLADRPSPKE